MNNLIKRILIAFFASIAITGVFAQRKIAFMVGISDYGKDSINQTSDSVWCNIHGANDVALLKPTLTAQGFKVTNLTNRDATAYNIREGIKQFSNDIKDGDIVYLHFSCHGQPFEDLSGDEEDGWDEALVPVDAQMYYQADSYQGENHIIDDELNTYLETIRQKAGHNGFVYVIIDACHAGSSYRGEEDDVYERGTRNAFSINGTLYHPRINTNPKFEISNCDGLADICLLEACRSYQVNREIKENGQFYGPLSFYINQQLQTTTLSNDISWCDKVNNNMSRRLIGQNMVIETSR